MTRPYVTMDDLGSCVSPEVIGAASDPAKVAAAVERAEVAAWEAIRQGVVGHTVQTGRDTMSEQKSNGVRPAAHQVRRTQQGGDLVVLSVPEDGPVVVRHPDGSFSDAPPCYFNNWPCVGVELSGGRRMLVGETWAYDGGVPFQTLGIEEDQGVRFRIVAHHKGGDRYGAMSFAGIRSIDPKGWRKVGTASGIDASVAADATRPLYEDAIAIGTALHAAKKDETVEVVLHDPPYTTAKPQPTDRRDRGTSRHVTFTVSGEDARRVAGKVALGLAPLVEAAHRARAEVLHLDARKMAADLGVPLVQGQASAHVLAACRCCGAIPDEHGNVLHINPTEEQRDRATVVGTTVGAVQEADVPRAAREQRRREIDRMRRADPSPNAPRWLAVLAAEERHETPARAIPAIFAGLDTYDRLRARGYRRERAEEEATVVYLDGHPWCVEQWESALAYYGRARSRP